MTARQAQHAATVRVLTSETRVRGRNGKPSVDLTLRADNRVLLTVEEAAERLGIGRSFMYELIGDGRVRSLRVGRLRRIPVDALDEFVARTQESTTESPA